MKAEHATKGVHSAQNETRSSICAGRGADAITYKDLAKEIGISRAHLDRVLNNRGNVSEKTRREVLEKIEALNFRPNAVGKALALQKKTAFGVIVSSDLARNGSFVYSIIEEGMQIAVECMRYYGVKFEFRHIVSGTGEEQAGKIEELASLGCAVIAMSREDSSEALTSAIRKASEAGVRFVFYSNVYGVNDNRFGNDFMLPTNSRREGRLAAQLLGCYMGRRGNVALLSGMTKNQIHQTRLSCAEEYFREHMPDIELCAVCKNVYPLDSALETARRLARENPGLGGLLMSCGHNVEIIDEIHRLGMHPLIVTFDFTQRAESYLAEGRIDALIGVDLRRMGYDVIKAAYSLAMDGSVERMEEEPILQIKLSGEGVSPATEERMDKRN